MSGKVEGVAGVDKEPLEVYKAVVSRSTRSDFQDEAATSARRVKSCRAFDTYNNNMLSSVNLVAYYTTLVLALFHATNVNAAPTRTTKRQVKNGNIAAPVARSNVAARLRQTSWREIQARDALRKSPFYRRQQASALPYATCQATYSSLVGVARYPNVEIYGGDVSRYSCRAYRLITDTEYLQPTPFEGGLFAQSETDCLNICQSRSE